MKPAQRDVKPSPGTTVGPAVNDNRRPRPSAAAAPRPIVTPAALQIRYANLTTTLEAESGILWARIEPEDGTRLTPGLLADVRHFHGWLRREFGHCRPETMPFRWLVWTTATPGPACAGLDLAMVADLLAAGDEAGLRDHVRLATELLLEIHDGLDLPIMTVALMQGDLADAGIDAALACDLVVVERQAGFRMAPVPSRLPPLATFALLRRRLGRLRARVMMGDGRQRSAVEMQELGLVDLVCEPGTGPATLRRHLAARAEHGRADLADARIRKRTNPLDPEALLELADLWVDVASRLDPAAVRALGRIARRRSPPAVQARGEALLMTAGDYIAAAATLGSLKLAGQHDSGAGDRNGLRARGAAQV